MDIHIEKIELAKRLLEKEDEAVLPEHVKLGIERGRKQAAEGKLTPFVEMKKKYGASR